MTAGAATVAGAARPLQVEAERVPGTPDIWFFVFFEAFLFTAYFTVYMVRRSQDTATFLEAQAQLSLATGVANALILLLSSWSMAQCVQMGRAGNAASALRSLLLTIGLALAFLAVKACEWTIEAGHGNTFTSNGFFAFYYFLTGIHFIHLLIGLVFLGVAFHQLRRPSPAQAVVETCAVYWHMVDFLWIMIFALLYLVR